jgi:hypothetical protein
MRLLLFIVLAFPILLSSCKKNKAAEQAFFVRASDVTVVPSTKQGTASHKITDLWLYVNGKFQGAYPSGHLMPIVSKGEPVHLDIFAGIKNNGIASTRIFWQFYEIFTLDTLVESGKTIEFPFRFRYNPLTTFAWQESFEGGSAGFALQKSGESWVNYRMAPSEQSFEGRSIQLGLSGDSLVAMIETTNFITLPKGNSNVYLELNYKCNDQFEVGLIAEDGTKKSALVVKEQENWNKIYIQLSTALNSNPISDKHKVFFRLIKRDVASPTVYLDNIKLIYLQ